MYFASSTCQQKERKKIMTRKGYNTAASASGRGVGTLPYMGYIGMCVLVGINRVSILGSDHKRRFELMVRS